MSNFSITRKQKAAFIIAMVLGMVVYPFSMTSDNIYFQSIAMPSLCLAFFFPFLIFIEGKNSRFKKGMALLAFGAGFNVFVLELIPKFYPTPPDFSFQVKIITDIALFACSGAGGGLMATQADTNTYERDEEQSSINVQHVSTDPALRAELITLKKSFKNFRALNVALLISIIVLLFVLH